MITPLEQQLHDSLGPAVRIERELGGGGMSRVFLARDVALGRLVVIKVLSPELAGGINVERFRREVQLTARLQHPHIVPLLTAGETGGLPYFTMPFVEGDSLRAQLVRAGEMPVAAAVRILHDVAEALAYAHASGVVHRDLKPENVLLAGGSALVTDFGIARALSAATGTDPSHALTSSGLALGTPAYMAPEQAAGDPAVDHRADLYALGLIAYELLTGAHPFTGRAPTAMLVAHATESPVRPGSRRTGIPDALDALVMRCLEKEPADRPSGAAEVARTLESILAQSGASDGVATVPSTSAAARPPSGRGARVAAMAATAVVGIAAVALTILMVRRGHTSAPAGVPSVAAAPSTTTAARSIAVLPFENLGDDRADEYLSDGITQELISALAQVRGVRVAARTSSFAFKGRHEPVSTIGRALDVGVVLEGTVQHAGRRLRVAAQLVDVGTGDVVWTERFDREMRDVFSIEDDLTHAMVRELRGQLAPGRAAHVPPDVAAYDLYLRGRYFWNSRRSAGELQKAIDYFQQAIARDSTFAPAYAGLADAYSLMGIFGHRAPREVFPHARAAAQRAVLLDSTLAEAQTSLGIVALFYDWRFPAAERTLAHAVALDSNSAPAHLFHGWSLFALGRADVALQEIETASRLDPLNLLIQARIGTARMFARRYADAERAARAAYLTDSTFPLARAVLADVEAQRGRPEDAIHLYVSGARGMTSDEAGGLGVALALAGRRAEALAMARDLEARAAREYTSPMSIAWVFAYSHEPDSAMVWIDRAVTERDPMLVFARADYLDDPLRVDPRFIRVLDRVGLGSDSTVRAPAAPR